MKQYESIKRSLKTYESPVDTEKLWSQTAHAIPQRKKRRAIVFWLIAGIGMLGMAWLGTRLLDANTSNAAYNIDNRNTKTSQPLLTSPLQDGSTLSQENTIKQLPAHTEIKKSATSAPDHPLQPADNTKQTQLQQTKSNNPNSVKENTVAAQKPGLTTTRETKGVMPSTGTASILLDQANEKNETDTRNTDAANTVHTSGFDMTTAVTDDQNDIPIKREEESTEQIPALSVDELNIYSTTQIPPVASTTINKRKQTTTHIELAFAQLIGGTQLQIISPDTDLEPKVAYYDQRIRSLESISSALSVGIQFNQKVELGLALRSNHLTTSTLYDWTTTQIVSAQGNAEIIIDENGNQHFVTDEVDIIRTTQWQAEKFSSHSWYEIGGTASVSLLKRHRLQLLAGAQTQIAFGYRSKGTWYGEEDNPVNYTRTEQPFSLTRPWYYGVHSKLRWHISNRWNMQFHLSYNQIQYRQKDQDIQFHHALWQTGVGLGYLIQ